MNENYFKDIIKFTFCLMNKDTTDIVSMSECPR